MGVIAEISRRPAARVSQTLLTFLLGFVALGSLAYGLLQSTEEISLGSLLTLSAVGLLCGWVLAALQVPGWVAAAATTVLGVEFALLAAQMGDNLPEWMTVPQDLTELQAVLAVVPFYFREWAASLLTGEATTDPLATALIWNLVAWAEAVWAGWAVRRMNRPLWGLAPAGVLLALKLGHAPEPAFLPLTAFLGSTLLLLALRAHETRETQWSAGGTAYRSSTWSALLNWAAILSLALMLGASLLPQVSLQEILEEIWPSEVVVVVVPPWGYPQSALGLSGPADFEQLHDVGLPRGHLVGTNEEELSRETVMEITTDELRPGLMEPPRTYYWRALVYDRYDGRGWSTTDAQLVSHEPRQDVTPDPPPFSELIRQEVTMITGTVGLVHTAGFLSTINRDAEVALRLPRPPEDVFGTFVEDATYRADSYVSLATEQQLRTASADYPEWIRERYLALPEDMPRRVLELAEQLVMHTENSYDQARAIENYLRTYPYTLDVPLPPADRDVVDYFLFDLQQGYCDYYATSMVVLARAAGLPARMVIGYASGAYNPDEGQFIVAASDAHAWVEIYFPAYGWIEFEPTGGRGPIERPGTAAPAGEPEPEDVEQSQIEELIDPPSLIILNRGGGVWPWILGGMALLALAGSGVYWVVAGGRMHNNRGPEAAVHSVYAALRRYGRMLSVPMQRGDTPFEFAANLEEHLKGLRSGRYWDRILSPAISEMHDLVDLYVDASYTTKTLSTSDKWAAIRTWDRLRGRLLASRFWPRANS